MTMNNQPNSTTPPLLIELTRVLYHLDYFRRNFRKVSVHKCDGQSSSCVVCCFKNLFTNLSLLMRESVLDPPHIHRMIEGGVEKLCSNNKVNNQAMIYESIIRQLEQSTMINNLHTQFSITKICLACRTTTYEESINQYSIQIDSSSLLTNDWPSFEFAVKTSLDEVEFCVQPNCHGQTKIFRSLTSLPSMLPICFNDSSPGLITLIPTKLRPHLIFETSKTIKDLNLKALILHSDEWGHATVFHHSRLNLWIFMDSRRVLSLCQSWIESRFHGILKGFRVGWGWWCQEEGSEQIVHCSGPCVPQRRESIRTNKVQQKEMINDKESERIYENWPPLISRRESDSGKGSSCSSSNSSVSRTPSSASATTTTMTTMIKDSRTNQQSLLIMHEENNTQQPPVNSNKYATVRRRVKYQRRVNNSKINPSLSLSVPDLTMLGKDVIKVQKSNEFEGVSSRSSIDGHRKVSFNCEVTLVDDVNNDEYIPHPIFQGVVRRLMGEGNSSVMRV